MEKGVEVSAKYITKKLNVGKKTMKEKRIQGKIDWRKT